MKLRRGIDGLHIFDRRSGMNILLDEVEISPSEVSRAPRFVSFALTNTCDLKCPFCYAPKQPASLAFESVIQWAIELDKNGTLGIGFGGGEPTLYPRFSSLCQAISESTQLSVGFTTHGHRLTPALRDELSGAVHFIRVSMDGINESYERIRERPFSAFLKQLQVVRDISAFGVNYVVNDTTIHDLDEAAHLVFTAGANELLLLPEYSTRGLSHATNQLLQEWVVAHCNTYRLSISEFGATENIPMADPFLNERGTQAYIHVTALGQVCRTSYHTVDALAITLELGLLATIETYSRADT